MSTFGIAQPPTLLLLVTLIWINGADECVVIRVQVLYVDTPEIHPVKPRVKAFIVYAGICSVCTAESMCEPLTKGMFIQGEVCTQMLVVNRNV